MSKAIVISNVPLLLTSFSASVTTGGAIYAFGVYGDAIKKSLHLSQTELDHISAAMFVAGLFSWIPGLIVDRFGVRRALMLGGTTGAVWSLLYWAICRRFIPRVWIDYETLDATDDKSYLVTILSLNGVLICLSCALIVGSMFKIAVVCSGPGTRGTAVGIAKGYVGLGSGIYASLFSAGRAPRESALDFLPVQACFFLVCVALPATILLPTHLPSSSSSQSSQSQPASSSSSTSTTTTTIRYDMTTQHFQMLYVSLAAVALLIVENSVSALLRTTTTTTVDETTGRDLGRVALLLLVWLGPIWALLILPRREQEETMTMVVPPPPPRVSSGAAAPTIDEEENVLSTTTTPSVGVVTSMNMMIPPPGMQQPQMETSISRVSSRSSVLEMASPHPPPSRVTSRTTLNHPYHSDDNDDDDYDGINERTPLRTSSYQTFPKSMSTESFQHNMIKSPPSSSLLPVVTQSPPSMPTQKEDYTLPQMLQTSSSWLMLWTTAILVGSGTYKTNNMGEMVESLGFDVPVVVPSALALFSVAQAAARVVTGVVSERTLRPGACCCCGGGGGGLLTHGAIPRPFYLVVASFLAVVVHLWLASPSAATTPMAFVTACTLSGISFGMAWPLMVLIVGEIFGLKHHAANYMLFDGSTKALGTIFLSDIVAGRIYEAHINTPNNVNGPGNEENVLTCVGIKCFQNTHLTVAGLAFTGVLASLALQYTSRHVYLPQSSHLHAG